MASNGASYLDQPHHQLATRIINATIPSKTFPTMTRVKNFEAHRSLQTLGPSAMAMV